MSQVPIQIRPRHQYRVISTQQDILAYLSREILDRQVPLIVLCSSRKQLMWLLSECRRLFPDYRFSGIEPETVPHQRRRTWEEWQALQLDALFLTVSVAVQQKTWGYLLNSIETCHWIVLDSHYLCARVSLEDTLMRAYQKLYQQLAEVRPKTLTCFSPTLTKETTVLLEEALRLLTPNTMSLEQFLPSDITLPIVDVQPALTDAHKLKKLKMLLKRFSGMPIQVVVNSSFAARFLSAKLSLGMSQLVLSNQIDPALTQHTSCLVFWDVPHGLDNLMSNLSNFPRLERVFLLYTHDDIQRDARKPRHPQYRQALKHVHSFTAFLRNTQHCSRVHLITMMFARGLVAPCQHCSVCRQALPFVGTPHWPRKLLLDWLY